MKQILFILALRGLLPSADFPADVWIRKCWIVWNCIMLVWQYFLPTIIFWMCLSVDFGFVGSGFQLVIMKVGLLSYQAFHRSIDNTQTISIQWSEDGSIIRANIRWESTFKWMGVALIIQVLVKIKKSTDLWGSGVESFKVEESWGKLREKNKNIDQELKGTVSAKMANDDCVKLSF